ncbi:DUF3613 domain-containing protein [Pseudomonas putida CSV86]|uniref:DUF3613 domain-containing protein n=1 Tax=Pseudomonas bharatica CSV86 TaxID=1005395 RepID=L1LZ64_9PSED|nr:DUF3613 domain-containing protein [Pseudomonas bharatica]NNJ17684.1 DUF3613 domain-containing protein [Pseudomonas bharatica CSV86]
MKTRILTLTLLASLPLLASAMPPGPSSKPQLTTETWLQLQPRGLHASDKPQEQTAREYDETMARWLKVYKYEIPEVFKWEKMDSGGAKGGGSN